jgi:hypothetical protein
MFGWGKKDKPKKKRNVPDVEIHVPELDIDRLEITLEILVAHVDVDATIGRPGNEFVDISIGVSARLDSAKYRARGRRGRSTRHRLLRRCKDHSRTSARGSGSSPGDTDGACRAAVPGLRARRCQGSARACQRDEEDKSVYQALDRGRAMLQRWSRTS